jgi:hypothetical protein
VLLAAAGAAVAAVLALQVTPQAKTSPPSAPGLPAKIHGLSVKQENITKTLEEDRRELYVDGVWLYSLRQGTELMATLEIGHFRSNAPWRSSDFDLSLAGQLGGSVPAVARLDGTPVYVSTARGLNLLAWDRNGYLLILGIRSTYKQPKELLRDAMAVSP